LSDSRPNAKHAPPANLGDPTGMRPTGPDSPGDDWLLARQNGVCYIDGFLSDCGLASAMLAGGFSIDCSQYNCSAINTPFEGPNGGTYVIRATASGFEYENYWTGDELSNDSIAEIGLSPLPDDSIAPSQGSSSRSVMSLKVTKDCFDRANGTRDIDYQLTNAPGGSGGYTITEQLSDPNFAGSSEVGGFHDNLRPTLFGTAGATTTNSQYFLVYPTAKGLNAAQWVPIIPMTGVPIKFNTIKMTNGANPAQNIIRVNGKLAPDC
jgi:hypothetical protein